MNKKYFHLGLLFFILLLFKKLGKYPTTFVTYTTKPNITLTIVDEGDKMWDISIVFRLKLSQIFHN